MELGCPCRNFKVWNADESEETARTYKSSYPRGAAEQFAESSMPEDGDEFELNVRDYLGRLFEVSIVAQVEVHLESSVRRVEDQATA
jgi:hypothetical protein